MITTAKDLLDFRETWLRLTTSTPETDRNISRLLEAAFIWASHSTRLLFAATDDIIECYSGDDSNQLYPAWGPIASVESLQIDGVEVALSTAYDVDGYVLQPARFSRKIVLRGQTFTSGVANVYIEYTAGAAPPEDLRQAIFELAAAKYAKWSRVGVSSTSLGDQSVSYSQNDMTTAITRVFDSYTVQGL